MKLKEVVTFSQGVGKSRMTDKLAQLEYYSQYDFEKDLNIPPIKKEGTTDSKVPILKFGDLVMSNLSQKVAIVSQENEGKLLSINFTRVQILDNKIDQLYFAYLFNYGSDVQSQKKRELQGSGLIQKIPLSALKNIRIPIVERGQQSLIGETYASMLAFRSSLNKLDQSIENVMIATIENRIKENESE